MRIALSFCLLLGGLTGSAMAQRDSPVWDSYLPRVVMYKERTTLDFEATWFKGGGPHEQAGAAQMYVLVYLEKDEKELLELAALEEHINKKNKKEDLILSVLEKKKLAKVLATQSAAGKSGKTLNLKKQIRGGSVYHFEFSFENAKILEQLKQLANFDETAVKSFPGDMLMFDDKFKLLIFVPVNDCSLATLIPQKQRDFYDFAHFMNTKTSIQYFKPLTQRFQMRRLGNGEVIANID